MRLHRFNGEHWYVDERPVWRRVLRWAFWPGGWETFSPKRPWRRPGDAGWSLRERLTLDKLSPMSLFGHRITYYGWGIQWDSRWGYWVAVWQPGPLHIYLSANGTPSEAHVWLVRPPWDVTHAAGEHERERQESFARQRAVRG